MQDFDLKNIFAVLVPSGGRRVALICILVFWFGAPAFAKHEVFIDVRTLFDRVDSGRRGILPSVLYGTSYDPIRRVTFNESTRFVPNPNALTFIRYLVENVPDVSIRFYNPSGVSMENIDMALRSIPSLRASFGVARSMSEFIVPPSELDPHIYDPDAADQEELRASVRDIIQRELADFAREMAVTAAGLGVVAETEDDLWNDLRAAMQGVVIYGPDGQEPIGKAPSLAVRLRTETGQPSPFVDRTFPIVISLENGFLREIPHSESGIPEIEFDYTPHRIPAGASQRQRTEIVAARVNRALLIQHGPFTNFLNSIGSRAPVESRGTDYRLPPSGVTLEIFGYPNFDDGTLTRWLNRWPTSDTKLVTFLLSYNESRDAPRDDKTRAENLIRTFRRRQRNTPPTETFRNILQALNINRMTDVIRLSQFYHVQSRQPRLNDISRRTTDRDLISTAAFEQRFSYMVGILETVKNSSNSTKEYHEKLRQLLGTIDPTDPAASPNQSPERGIRENSVLLRAQTRAWIESGNEFLRVMHEDTYANRSEFLHPATHAKMTRQLTAQGQIECLTEVLNQMKDTGI